MSKLFLNGSPPLPSAEVEQIAELVLSGEMPKVFFHLSLSLVDDQEMKRYNRLYRGLNEPTDVLSFVTAQVSKDHDLGIPKEKLVNCNSQVLCDIFIDIKQLDRQRGKNSMESEFRRILVHGLLHLAGYDHIRNSDAELMKEKEENYLKQLQGDT